MQPPPCHSRVVLQETTKRNTFFEKKPHWRTGKPCINKRTKFPGITQDAKTLGCNRIHLYLVLDGRRESKSLTRRYKELKKQQAA